MPRYFTLEQAERLLPLVESSILVAIARKSELQQADHSFRELTRKIMMSGGMAINVEAAALIRHTRDRSAEKLQEVMAEIESIGCQVKDLDIGLLDFLTLYRGREVCLCWRLGETRIEFWHGLEEGFRGRKAIDDDFLSNHRGDPLT